jgi:hypothetical protein
MEGMMDQAMIKLPKELERMIIKVLQDRDDARQQRDDLLAAAAAVLGALTDLPCTGGGHPTDTAPEPCPRCWAIERLQAAIARGKGE